MAHNRIPDWYAKQMREMYEGPDKPSLRSVADHFGYDKEAVRNAIVRVGGVILPCGKRRADSLPVPDEKVRALVRCGWPPGAIAARYDVPVVAVSRAIQRTRRAEARQ